MTSSSSPNASASRKSLTLMQILGIVAAIGIVGSLLANALIQ
ncbi:hypothetical protein [Paraburkholderia sartisoli]|nr:hypothetical protein [Paraburkholderia sartisoli]